ARTPGAREALDSLAADTDPRVVASALGALQRLGGDVPDAALLARARAALAHSDVVVRATAIGILSTSRYPGQVDELVSAYRRAESDPTDEARLAAVRALGYLAEQGAEERTRLAAAFFARASRSREYLVRAAAMDAFGEDETRRRWGEVFPAETGRSIEDYRDLVRRYVLGPAPTVTIETERGSIRLQLFGYEAPLTVDNFLRLVDRRFFDNGRWHRVVPNFVIQDGDPRGDGSGGPGTVLRDEINRRRYERATLGMALSGPDTGGSQFFITHSPQPHLDGGYTVFGQVASGLEVVDRVVQGDRIRRIVR
ncbi:MAG TPA: peptidylprolyl isomerase, partial [Gemmatimonadales bacterium]|nr:peptidylprolyl isomerase [Gemmatimonadales bacterium]